MEFVFNILNLNFTFYLKKRFYIKKAPILSPSNYFSSTYHNYSNAEKLYTENLLSYWVNFISYNDPNYMKFNKDLPDWLPFIDKTTNLAKMNATKKLSTGRYLLFGTTNINMSSGFARHQCDFWNYTSDSNTIFSVNHRFYFQEVFSILALTFILY